jgi:hypothetical protein
MNAPLSPLVSEFETEQQAAAYDQWFRTQVELSLKDSRPAIAHDQVMAEIDLLNIPTFIARAEFRALES